jgi:AcrR family transcriptional regulator
MSKTAAVELIWLRREPGERKTRLTRAMLAEAAIAIADKEGFDAVSIRRIAAELGAGAMTLYHYIRTKADLVALMDDALMGEIVLPDGELPSDWRAALVMIARRTRDVFARHPWALFSMQGALPGPNALRHFEQSLAAVAGAPFDEAGRLELLNLVDDFVMGHALRAGEVHAWTAGSPAAAEGVEEFWRRELATGRFPHTAALMKNRAGGDGKTHLRWLADPQRFDRALTVLLDGALSRTRRQPREGQTRRKVAHGKRGRRS